MSPTATGSIYATISDPAAYAASVSGLSGGSSKGFVAEAVPDHLVDPLGVPAIGREQVHDQQMDSGLEKLDRLSREGPNGMAAILVAW